MLRNTFIHLPHIGKKTEERLWQNGITSWKDIIENKNDYSSRFQHISGLLEMSEHKLKMGDIRFFTDRMTADQHWRIFHECQNQCAYLDIETTGLNSPSDHITTIALYDGEKIKYYVHGKNLDRFKKDIMGYKVLITYNGKCFDVPFIEREFGLHLSHAHLDLRYILKSVGISGGLKSCEHQLGLSRGDLEGVDGYFAVLLWRDYQNGNKSALDTLLAYNIEDTINLEKLMIYAYEKKLNNTPIENEKFKPSPELKITKKQIHSPFRADESTIRRIKNKYY